MFGLTVIDQNGCIASDKKWVHVGKDFTIFVANAFTPNGDRNNDWLYVQGNENVVNVDVLRIFDRWGNHIFEAENFAPNVPGFGWDGTFLGQPMNSAVFVWYAKVQFIDGSTKIYKGDVTLIR